MAFSAKDVVEQARHEDPRFTAEQVPDDAVLSYLNRKHKRVRQYTFERCSDVLLETETISDPENDAFPDGYTFTAAWDQIYGGTIHFAGSANRTIPLELIPYKQRNRPPTSWPAYVKGDKLYLVGQTADWRGVDSIDVDLVYAVSELTDLPQDLDLPDRAKSVMVAFAAEYMAKRHEEVSPQEYKASFKADRVEEEKDYQLWLASRTSRAETGTWREVW